MVEFNSYVIEDNKISLIGKKDNLFISIPGLKYPGNNPAKQPGTRL